MREKHIKKTVCAVVITALFVIGMFAHVYAQEGRYSQTTSLTSSNLQQGVSSTTISVESYHIRTTEQGDELEVEHFGRLLVPGKPMMPSKILAIAIPPGAHMTKVTYETSEPILLQDTYDIVPTPLPETIGQTDTTVVEQEQQEYDNTLLETYSTNTLYPETIVEFVQPAFYRAYNLVDVRVTPFQYRPLLGELLYYPDITVHVHYTVTDHQQTVIDPTSDTEVIAQEIISNYHDTTRWYEYQSSPGREIYDFVIVTLDSLVSSVTPLVDWETSKGRSVQVVTTSWINTNYAGYDLAEKIRNFLREKYPVHEWGIEHVLLVGHYDDVPMRRCWQDMGYGKPETDYYYAELSLPDSESWDADGDHHWGEDTDPIDFYAEVNVGRIPWSDPATVQHICEKSVAYEQNEDPSFKKNILLLGAYFWSDTDNAALMETKVDQPWMMDWTMTRMYEEAQSQYPCDYDLTYYNVRTVWSQGTFGFVDWAGHGSPTACHELYPNQPFVDTATCNYLNDEYPSIIFADACSNSDTDNLNIGQAMLEQGGIGFLGSTKVAYGMHAWNSPYDGSSQSMDYFFTTHVTYGEETMGEAHQWSLREMYQNGLWYYPRYETFEWGALWGNPDLRMGTMPLLELRFPEGLPDYLAPGVPTSITVQIKELADTYIPGTGQLHYRYDGGEYLTVPLDPIIDDLYEAILPPASCGDTPEYYFSAEGVEAGVIYSPYNAPDSIYTALVGELIILFQDDFETDQGWTVYWGADTGNWERADPQEVSGTAGVSQPEDDHTPEGTLCYVTGPLTGGGAGDYDVDGGPTHLTSPVFDLEGKDAFVSYWRWYHISTEWDDELVIEISNDDGASWTIVEIIDDRETWTYVEWRVSDFVTPTSQVRVRFTADDSPNNSLVEALVDDFMITEFVCEDTVLGDINGDGVVNVEDLLMLLAAWGPCDDCENCPEDLNGDCLVNVEDLLILLGNWG